MIALGKIILRPGNKLNLNSKIRNLNFSSINKPQYKLEELSSRCLVKVEGCDAGNFLQGLITNDINFLPPKGYDSIYSMFLNSKGRVISDSIIYKIPDAYLVECDSTILCTFINHLKMYKLRKQLTIEPLSNYKIYALFDPQHASFNRTINKESNLFQMGDCEKGLNINAHWIFCDPRLKGLGYRIITNKSLDDIQDKLCLNSHSEDEQNYKWFRYSLGVGEGITDIPPTNCFPLEANVDYLHGINFHKGCYIGQELTARTYHTGVTRKRLMPLFFEKQLINMPEVTDLKTNSNERLGKLRGIHGQVGLGLLYFNKALSNFSILDTPVKAAIPYWWPDTESRQ